MSFFGGRSKKSESRDSEAAEARSSGAPRRAEDRESKGDHAVDVRALFAENASLKTRFNTQHAQQMQAVKKAENDQMHALQRAVQLQESLRGSEEQLTTLRTGFISLDEKHSALQEESRALQKALQERQGRIDELQAENAQLQKRVKELELEDGDEDKCGTSTSKADSAVVEAGRDLKGRKMSGKDKLSTEILAKLHEETQTLRADNERLHASLDAAQGSRAELEAELDSWKKTALEKDAEIEASAKGAQQAAEVKQRLEADLVVAREEKKLIEQALVRLPLEAQRRHEEEADRLRCELDASRRNEEQLTMELRAQVALDEARRSREMDQMVAVPAARQRSHRDGATTWPYSEEETHEDLGDSSDAPRTHVMQVKGGIVSSDASSPRSARHNGHASKAASKRRSSAAGARPGLRDRADDVVQRDAALAGGGVLQERLSAEFPVPPGYYPAHYRALPYAPLGFGAAYLSSPPALTSPLGASPGSAAATATISPLPWPPPLPPTPAQDPKGSPPAADAGKASPPADEPAKQGEQGGLVDGLLRALESERARSKTAERQLEKIRRQSEPPHAASVKRDKAHAQNKNSSSKGKERSSKSRNSKDSKDTPEARRDKAPKKARDESEQRSSRRSSKHASRIRELPAVSTSSSENDTGFETEDESGSGSGSGSENGRPSQDSSPSDSDSDGRPAQHGRGSPARWRGEGGGNAESDRRKRHSKESTRKDSRTSGGARTGGKHRALDGNRDDALQESASGDTRLSLPDVRERHEQVLEVERGSREIPGVNQDVVEEQLAGPGSQGHRDQCAPADAPVEFNAHIEQIAERLKQVLEVETRSRGITGLNLDFEFGAGDPITDTVAPEQNKEGPEAAGNVTGGAEPPGYALCREQGNDDGVLVEEHDYDDGAHAAATAQDFEMRERDMRASKILALEHALANDISISLPPSSASRTTSAEVHGTSLDEPISPSFSDNSDDEKEYTSGEEEMDDLPEDVDEDERQDESMRAAAVGAPTNSAPGAVIKQFDFARLKLPISSVPEADAMPSAVDAYRIKWAQYGLEDEAKKLFSSLRKQWGSVSAGFRSMMQLKADQGYERAEYGSFVEKEVTAHILKTKITKRDWHLAVDAICQHRNIPLQAAGEMFDAMDTHNLKEITQGQLCAGYKGAGALKCGGGGIPLSHNVKGVNKKKGSKLTKFHHLPSGADKIPEHRRRKVRSLGELLDWHVRVSSSAAATFQGIGQHNGFGWEVSNTELAVPKAVSTPRTHTSSHSHTTTPRSLSRLTTPRDENPNVLRGSHQQLPIARSSLSAVSLPPPKPSLPAGTAPDLVESHQTNIKAADPKTTDETLRAHHVSRTVPAALARDEVTDAVDPAELFEEDSSGETAKAAAAAVLLVALSSLQLKDSGADTSGQHMLLVAALTSACRHIQRLRGLIPAWFQSLSPAAGNGISRDSFHPLLTQLGVAHVISVAEASRAFFTADLHRSGSIEYPQLAVLLQSQLVQNSAQSLLQSSSAGLAAPKRARSEIGHPSTGVGGSAPLPVPKNAAARKSASVFHGAGGAPRQAQSPKPSPGRFDPGYFHSMPSNIEPPAHKRVAARTQGEQLDYDARMGRQSIVKRSSAVSATRTASPAPRAESGASLTSNTSDTRNLIERHGGWQNCISHGV